MRWGLAIVAVLAIALAFGAAAAPTPQWTYRLVAEYPHDPTAFTEGLAMVDGHLLESTGHRGQSRLFIRELRDGRVLRSVPLAKDEFGEGATVVGGRIFQLTWTSGVGYVYDLKLKRRHQFPFAGEGWGLTFDGHELIRSDGSDSLRFHSPEDFRETHRVSVHDDDGPVTQINELEWAQGLIYANVWHSKRIAVIRPQDGQVIAWIDLGALDARLPKPAGWDEVENVLNGIAFDPATSHFYVTGKFWPKLFEIDIDHDPAYPEAR